MLRLFLAVAVLAGSVMSCATSACQDLCDDSMPCTGVFTCLQSHCVVDHADAGQPPSCK